MEQNKSYSYSNNQPSDTGDKKNQGTNNYTSLSVPQIKLPKGGGSILSIDEKFSVNAANGTAGCSFSFPFSPSRNEFMPSMALSYSSGAGNGIFGLGWSAEPAAIVRRTDKKLPQYKDEDESDVFIFSGAEDLVPVFNKKDESGNWIKDITSTGGVTTVRYRPRIEGGFAHIEKITEANGNVYWKVTSSSNVVSVFGKSKTAQLCDPADPARIFKWLFEFSYDDKGNCFQYEYKKEDKVNVPNELYEKNRLNDFSIFSNTYLKRIKYCNKSHFNRSSIDFLNWEIFLSSINYLLELVLDYGEHDINDPQPNDDNGWLCRTDAFSEYRAGFEIRTCRLCQRVLMFHEFIELGTTPCLVSSMDLDYESGAAFTFLRSVAQKGYIRKADGSYSVKSLPPVEFTYEKLGWDTEVRSIPKESMENLPTGIDDHYYQWIDLYKEGISGILIEQSGAWYYKSNSGGSKFEGIQLVSPKPSLNGISTGALHFADIEANGQQFLVNGLKGYYELNDGNEWLPYKNFTNVPTIDLHDPNLKMLDLDGDGMADILISEEEVFTWYASKGKDGFKEYQTTRKLFDEEKGPNIVFADSTESIVLADMSGDGLMDIVRIRFSEVCYWPNLGYGKFGAKVNMSNAPVFDNAENFSPRYIKLADLDGSGTTDIVYLGHDSFKIYFNQSGNSWSEVNIVRGINPLPFQKIDEHANISIVDLLGNGTGCIVWSSSLPQHTGKQLQYIDLMGGKKPHILTSYKNNMGKEVFVEYKPSTFFYLQDKKAGTPWITRLPFPVQCVSQTVMIDQIRKSRFSSQYFYHHGYYDHHEREFRGFGRVDQTDTEDFENFKKHSDPGGVIQLVDEGFHQPPVFTKSWFHTGAFLDKEKIFTQFAHEYYNNNIIPEKGLTDPPLPNDITTDEWREAFRACKGLLLRAEVYSIDGSDKQEHPYTTTNQSCLIQMLQPKLQNVNAVFMVQQSEALTYTYERNPADPRIAHNMTIETDEFGNVVKAAAISYGRKTTDIALTPSEQAEQSKTHIIFSENNFTNKIDTIADFHLPLAYESKTYHLTGLIPQAGDYFTIAEIKNGFEQAAVIPYESLPGNTIKQKRLIEHVRSRFLKNDQSTSLPLGVIESLVLPFQSAKLSMTPGLRDSIYGDKVSDELLINEGKYVHFNDADYWIVSGTQKFDANNFFQITEVNDPFGFKSQIQYDVNYRLFIQKTIDAIGNESSVAGFNYRSLSPYLISDINDNRTGMRTDELGMVISTFVMGKPDESKGDLMDTTTVEASVNDRPSAALEYDLFNYKYNNKPNVVKTTVCETHYFESIQTGKPVVFQNSYAYSDGNGAVIMSKMQAEPGMALQENEDGTVVEVDTTPNLRWIGNGRTIQNNKGKAVKQYEPYFSTTFEFEDSKQLVERGVTPVITYDSAGRAIRTDLPDGTFIKTEFDSWIQKNFDQNDTVLESQWYKDRIILPVAGVATSEEIAAANKAAAHANTPSIAYLDSLGRNFLAVVDNGSAGKLKTTTETNTEGNLCKITDARGNIVMQYKYDMLSAQLYHSSMDAGERWIVNDVIGKPLRAFDSRNHVFRHEYDNLHRPVKSFVKTGNGTEINTEKIIYGEGLPNDKSLNMRGKSYQHFDSAGMTVNAGYDFKGNPLQTTRQLCNDYKNDIDWNTNPLMEQAIFASSAVFDALNRPVILTAADQSFITPTYNEGNLLNKVEVQIKGVAQKTVFVKDINYDVKGQRQSIVYGNDTVTSYQYDSKTFRLTQSQTTGKNGTDLLQKLQYTYDPVGNITSVKDLAQQNIFFNNTVVSPSAEYVYDAIYRLINASGREHIGQNKPPSAYDEFRTNLPMPGDGSAMRNYSQSYEYDAAGNILKMIHAAGNGSWTRMYDYETTSNRLKSNKVGSLTETYQYDEHGNIKTLSHLQGLNWNYKDQLQNANLGGGGVAYYVYDSSGQRTRKVIERLDGSKEERIYLGGFELFHKKDNANTITEETETLHVIDDGRRIAIVETKTIKNALPSSEQLTRYQYSNHLGSSSLELDDKAAIISYEEYHPYGTTSYQAKSASISAAAKRYRYTGMERDEESGLEYHTARYYLPWLGRWLSADPIGIEGGMNLYCYSSSNPINRSDKNGQEDKENEYCFTPGCGTFDPKGFLKDIVFGAGEGVYESGKELYESTEHLQEVFNKEFETLIKDPAQFVKDIENLPQKTLEGMKQQLLSIANQGAEYYDAVEHGRYRSAARILAKNVTDAAVQAALSEVGGEILFAEKAAVEVSFAGRLAGKAEKKILSGAEKKALSSAEKKLAGASEKSAAKASAAEAKAAKISPQQHALSQAPVEPAPVGPAGTTPRINTGQRPVIYKTNCIFVSTAGCSNFPLTSTDVSTITGYPEGFVQTISDVDKIWQSSGMGSIPPINFSSAADALNHLKNFPKGYKFMVVYGQVGSNFSHAVTAGIGKFGLYIRDYQTWGQWFNSVFYGLAPNATWVRVYIRNH